MNVWLALASSRHIHHQLAKAWFIALDSGQAAFCRITQMGFLRLITNHRVMAGEEVSQRRAWSFYEDLASDRRVIFVPEPPDLEITWKRYTQASFTGSNLWTDAYLAAMAATHGMTLVSFDRGLARMRDLQTLILSPSRE